MMENVPSSALGTQGPPDTCTPPPPAPPSSPHPLGIHLVSLHLGSLADCLGTETLTNSREQEPSSFSHSLSLLHSRCSMNILNQQINE